MISPRSPFPPRWARHIANGDVSDAIALTCLAPSFGLSRAALPPCCGVRPGSLSSFAGLQRVPPERSSCCVRPGPSPPRQPGVRDRARRVARFPLACPSGGSGSPTGTLAAGGMPGASPGVTAARVNRAPRSAAKKESPDQRPGRSFVISSLATQGFLLGLQDRSLPLLYKLSNGRGSASLL